MVARVKVEATKLSRLYAEMVQSNPYGGPPLDCSASDDGKPYADPVSAYIAWDRRIAEKILSPIANVGGHIWLVTDALEPVEIDPLALLDMGGQALKIGMFDPTAWRLQGLAIYRGASLYVPNEYAELVRRSMRTNQTGGRPEHPAKAWYAERGFQRLDRTIKALQAEMSTACGTTPPSADAIRRWEKDAKATKMPETPPA